MLFARVYIFVRSQSKPAGYYLVCDINNKAFQKCAVFIILLLTIAPVPGPILSLLIGYYAIYRLKIFVFGNCFWNADWMVSRSSG
jgi:hypothetical protein